MPAGEATVFRSLCIKKTFAVPFNTWFPVSALVAALNEYSPIPRPLGVIRIMLKKIAIVLDIKIFSIFILNLNKSLLNKKAIKLTKKIFVIF